jgi:hypothetical protein
MTNRLKYLLIAILISVLMWAGLIELGLWINRDPPPSGLITGTNRAP